MYGNNVESSSLYIYKEKNKLDVSMQVTLAISDELNIVDYFTST